MATQTEVDAACERLREYMLTDNLDDKPPQHILEATCKLAIGYVDLTDPTPITPEALEAEGFTVNEDGVFVCGEVKICRNFREGEWLIQFGNLTCVCLLSRKTMGGVRLAMMQARGAK